MKARRAFRAMLCALALAAHSTPAFAWGFRSGERSFGMRLGLMDPTRSDGLDDMSRRGASGGFSYSRFLAEWFALGFDTDILYFRKENQGLGPGDRRLGGTSTTGFVTGRLNLVFDQPWTLFVLGGAGVHRTSGKIETFTTSLSTADQGFAVLAAGGLETFLIKDLSLSFQARFHGLSIDKDRFGLENAEFLSYQLGINYWFGVR